MSCYAMLYGGRSEGARPRPCPRLPGRCVVGGAVFRLSSECYSSRNALPTTFVLCVDVSFSTASLY
eukprot:5827887-Pyramimonas_sp.AAC.1